jgi:adenylylsulfate kinase-like enzyme
LTRGAASPRIAGHANGDRYGRSGGALMARGPVPVLWITGPAGVGKSTVSSQLFTELAGSGVPTAFADADAPQTKPPT